MSLRQPIKLSDLDKSRMKHGGLLNKHTCGKKRVNISCETAETVNFYFSHTKSMGTISCHSNQRSYPTGIQHTYSSIGSVIAPMTSQNGGQDGRHGS